MLSSLHVDHIKFGFGRYHTKRCRPVAHFEKYRFYAHNIYDLKNISILPDPNLNPQE